VDVRLQQVSFADPEIKSPDAGVARTEANGFLLQRDPLT
jgi:hypothetical protein